MTTTIGAAVATAVGVLAFAGHFENATKANPSPAPEALAAPKANQQPKEPPVVFSNGGTDWAALRNCDHETKPGDTASGCGVLDRVPDGSHVDMWCWRDTAAPEGYPYPRWFYVTEAAGSPHPGWSGWMYAELVKNQTKVPPCDSRILAAHPLPLVKPLVFQVIDGCASKGVMTAESSGFAPGRPYTVYVGYPNNWWRYDESRGTVSANGSLPWRVACPDIDKAADMGFTVTDEATGRMISTPTDITFRKPVAVPAPPPPPATAPAPPAPQPPAPPVPGAAPTSNPGLTARPVPPPLPPSQQPPTRTITVFNKLTNGPTQMVEDKPAYLSSVTRNFCKRDGCALPGTDVGTGAQLTATCQVIGVRTTNGNDRDPVDDANPQRYESSLWYGIRWLDGRFGYISEVWIDPAYRGGLGLPTC